MKLHPIEQRAGARKGNVAVIVAVSLTALFGIIALTVDGGMLMDKRRQAQCAGDSAALAGASDLYYNWWVGKGRDTTGTAAVAARAEAAANGYTHGVDGCTVTVNIPPTSGIFAGMVGHVEVIISGAQPRYFSRLQGSADIAYQARAVARGRTSSINNAIIVLDPGQKGALNAGGNGSISVTGSPIQVNSNNSEAMIANGGGAMTADKFLVAGSPGWSTPGGGSFTGPIVSNSDPIPDPLASLPYPDKSTLTIRSTNKVQMSGNKTYNLQPGIYVGGISASGGDIRMAPGIYYMDGGGFSLSGQAQLTGTGVMIFNAPTANSDTISMSGGGNVFLTPMTTGPYQGISLFQTRESTAALSVSGSSGASMVISGTFYAAGATLNVTGNGTQQTIGSQYISNTLVLGGNGSYAVNWNAADTPGSRELQLVE